MPIRVTCPSCQAAFTVEDDQRGERIRCTKCEAAITVPDARDDAVQENAPVNPKAKPRRDDDNKDDAPEKRPIKKGAEAGGRSVLMIVLVVGVALLVLGGLCVVPLAAFWFYLLAG